MLQKIENSRLDFAETSSGSCYGLTKVPKNQNPLTSEQLSKKPTNKKENDQTRYLQHLRNNLRHMLQF